MSDLAAQTALLKQHHGWLAQNANHWARLNPRLDYEDLMQEGRLALLRADEQYDPQRGVKFLTYATLAIQRAMSEHARHFAHPMKIPRLRGGRRIVVSCISFDAPLLDDGSRSTLADRLPEHEAEVGLSQMNDLMSLAEQALLKLKPQQQAVLKARFLDGRKLHEVGKDYGVTRERIRQIESKALRLLRANRTLKCA